MIRIDWNRPTPPVIVKSTNVSLYRELDDDFKLLSHSCVVRKMYDKTYDRLWNMFPGTYCNDENTFQKYSKFYSKEFEDGIYPRGNLDSDVAVVGFAPGWVDRECRDAMWLLGPSSRLLRDSLGKSVYFTNLKWTSFERNNYDENTDFSSEIERLGRELQLLEFEKIIFLGKYSPYQEVAIPSGVQVLNVYHPSYLLRGQKDFAKQNWFKKIADFLGESNVVFEDVVDVSKFSFIQSIFRDDEYLTLRDKS